MKNTPSRCNKFHSQAHGIKEQGNRMIYMPSAQRGEENRKVTEYCYFLFHDIEKIPFKGRQFLCKEKHRQFIPLKLKRNQLDTDNFTIETSEMVSPHTGPLENQVILIGYYGNELR